MAARPHPDAWLLAYRIGYAQVRLISLAESNWLHADAAASMVPDSVEQHGYALSSAVSRLDQLLRNRRQKGRCQEIVRRMAVAWDDYRGGWKGDAHEAALANLAEFEPEEEYRVARDALLQCPLNAASWLDLKRALSALMDELPGDLGRLAQLGQAVAQASFPSLLDAPDDLRERSPSTHVTVTIHDRIQAVLRGLSRGLNVLTQLDCDLSTLTYSSALVVLDRFHNAVIQTLTALAGSHEVVAAQAHDPRLRPTERAALDSHDYALSQMQILERGRGPTYAEIHAWLRENYDYPGDGDLPSLENWSRYLRSALRKSDRAAARSRHPMPTTRSVVQPEMVYTQRQASADG